MRDFPRNTLVELLAPAELAMVRAFAIRRTHRDGEVIHDRGDEALSAGVVVSGQVRLLHLGRGGQEMLVSVLGTGENYGDTTLFGHARRTHRAVAVGETVIDHIPADAFRQLLIHPTIVRAFYTVASHRLGDALDRIDDLRTLPPEVRLAKLLVGMLPAHGVGRIDCLQEDLASQIGVTTVTLAKALGALRRAGLMTTGYRHVSITDGTALADWIAAREAD